MAARSGLVARICQIAAALFLAALVPAHADDGWKPAPGHEQIPIWPGTPPDAAPMAAPEFAGPVEHSSVAGRPWIYVAQVSQPTMTVYQPKSGSTGAAVIVFPGGGYEVLAIDLEGTEVCDWLTDHGIACVLLKYRVPGADHAPKSGAYPNSPMALEDAQRTIGLVRLHAAAWHIDPHKIGVLGFSAGGHLVAAVSTNFNKRIYPAVDAADAQSSRPDFAVALYPGHMMEHTTAPHTLNPFVPVTPQTPPTFIVQAENDPVDSVENSLVYFAALKAAGVPAELHIYASGGHAFGLRRTDKQITDWPDLMLPWLKSIGMIR